MITQRRFRFAKDLRAGTFGGPACTSAELYSESIVHEHAPYVHDNLLAFFLCCG